jgi:hypothetical protein
MRKKWHRAEIIIESHEVMVIRFGSSHPKVFCGICRSRVNAISLEKAADVAGLDLDALKRLIDTREIHFISPSDGGRLLCANSLGNKTVGGQL